MQNKINQVTVPEDSTTTALPRKTTTIPLKDQSSLAEESLLLNEALFLYDLGVNVFLTNGATQRAIGRFSEYDPITDREELAEVCEEYPSANLQIVLGKKHNLIALGVGVGDWKENGDDSLNKMSEKNGLPDTLAYQMPTGEKYYLFKLGSESLDVERMSGLEVLRACERLPVYPSVIDGQQVEKHGNASTIQELSDWLVGNVKCVPPNDTPTLESQNNELATPEDFDPPGREGLEEASETADKIQNPEKGQEEVKAAISDPVDALRRKVTTWVASGSDKSTTLTQALEWNRANGDPIKMDEIVNVVEELTDVSAGDMATLTPRDLLFKLAEGMIPFHDDQSKPYFFYEGEAFSVPSDHVKNRLTHHYLREMKDLPPTKELRAVLDILESRARFDGPRISLYNRVANSDGAIIYDLRDKRYVKVTPKGWEIIPSFPLFRRYQHLQPQTEPLSGGDPWRVFDYLTVSEESQLLVMVYIVSLFVPRIAHPVFAVCGDQGSSKSFFCTVINRLVDPTLTERVIQPKNVKDLVQTLRQKYVTVLDNLSKIDNQVSDIFCQVCTGGSISYRQLYTDEGEHIAQFRHVVMLNSISLAIVNADLMDRSIILKLRRIDPQDRKPEHELWEAFESARPGILGGIFDTIAKAMEIYPTITVENLPRLADFAKWGYAIAEALGKSGGQFLEDFNQNVKRQNESVVEKNVLCQAVITLMAERNSYLAKVSDAHATLKSIAKQDAKDETFPKLPHNLRTSLDKLRASLLEHGIAYQYFERGSAGVKILFTKSDSSATSSPSEPVTLPALADKHEAGEPDEALPGIPEVEFDEMPEVIHG